MPPRHDNNNVGATKNWIACNNGGGNYYLLNDGSFAIADVISAGNGYTSTDIYFKTEVRCHIHAERYYQAHGKDYPYFDRLLELCDGKEDD